MVVTTKKIKRKRRDSEYQVIRTNIVTKSLGISGTTVKLYTIKKTKKKKKSLFDW